MVLQLKENQFDNNLGQLDIQTNYIIQEASKTQREWLKHT